LYDFATAKFAIKLCDQRCNQFATAHHPIRDGVAQLVVNQGRSIRDAAEAMDGFLGA
jgi:hypothetical protein